MQPIVAPSRTAERSLSAATGSALLEAVWRHARVRGGELAAVMLDDGGARASLTFGQLAGRVPGLSHAISGMAGPNDVVMLEGRNDCAHVAWFCAALAAGVRVLLLNPRLAAAELADLARRSNARAIIGGTEEIAAALGLGRLRRCLANDDGAARDGAMAEDTPPGPPGSVVLHTSGTTGAGKLAWRESPALDADGANVIEATGLGGKDRLLAAIPLSHSYGVDMLAAALMSGATIEILPEFDAPLAARRLAAGVTVFPAVPFMIEALAGAALPASGAPGRPRLVFSAGGALPAGTRTAFERAWDVPVGDLYGASELGSVTFNDPASTQFRAGSVGRPMRGVSVRVLDPDDAGRILPAGSTGQVAVRAPSMLTTYLDAPGALEDGHWLTGDLGHLDEGGRLHITGRLKLLIDTGGAKVNPLEVEAALARHPGIAECVVVPLPLSGTVTKLRALFVARDGVPAPTAEEARAFLKRSLSPDKVPRVFERVGALPKSSTGKVLRRAITGD